MPASKYDWNALPRPTRFAHPPITAIVSGPMACFTRPEHKSERVSYEVMTPTAAAGALESVFWKPEFQYVITGIDVLAPVRWLTMRTNETGKVINARNPEPFNTEEERQQRTSLLLRDVSYRVHAQVWVHPGAERSNEVKFRDQLRRRIDRGQAFRTPYLGMREMVADVAPDDPGLTPQAWDADLGPMLHSITRQTRTGAESYGWFDAQVRAGHMNVPVVAGFVTGGTRASA